MSRSSFTSTLVFEGYEVSTASLKLPGEKLSEFEKKVLDFCRQWTSGKEIFEFQTSGSTGKPQKIQFTRHSIIASARLTQQAFHLSRSQKALLCLDPDFVAGKMMIVRALEIGMNLHCLPPSGDPLEHWEPESIDLAAMVPYQLETTLKSEASTKKLTQIKTIIIGGSSVSETLLQKLQSLPTQFYETYGMTETLTHIAIRKLNPAEKEFHALPGVRVSLDERQCLSIQASHLGSKAIQTNDLADALTPSSFKVIGRYDNVINTAGVKVSPEIVERKIAPILQSIFPGVEYFVGGVKDESFGEKVVLAIESPAISLNKKDELMAGLKPILKKWEVPKMIKATPQFVRTSSGKVNRKATLML